ncbi:MAG: hypothetical protein ACOC9D_02225, partial [Thermodesulfobacteriota bacterium]
EPWPGTFTGPIQNLKHKGESGLKSIKPAALILICLGLLFSGCAPGLEYEPLPQKASLAVAGFGVPENPRELFPESRLPSAGSVNQDILDSLDGILKNELEKRGRQPYRGLALVRQCREIVLQEHPEERLTALDYWTLVGRCIPADYLLVPQLLEWQEREGGQWGVEEAARVAFDLYLLDVRDSKIADRFQFEQEQQSLTENLLTFSRFLKRQGRWVPAETLAREGIIQGVEELGL